MADPLYGRENLAAFFAAQVRARLTGEPIKIHIVGDSKAARYGVTEGYGLDQLIPSAANGYPVAVTYEGFGGQNSYLWANNEDTDFVAQHPDTDLLIVDFGTNEGYNEALGGQQTIEQTKANNLAAINAIRASRSPSQLSILLLGQTPANNYSASHNQTTENMILVNGKLKEVAQETNSAYYDTLQLFTRAHAEAGWMDLLPGGISVHPGNPMNLVFVGELGKSLFPMPFKLPATADGSCVPALQNGWTPWTAGQQPRATLRNGIVFLDGLIKPGATAVETTLFQLPSGYRPAVNRFVTVAVDNAGSSKTIQILPSGIVRLGGTFGGSFLSLDGISFRVD